MALDKDAEKKHGVIMGQTKGYMAVIKKVGKEMREDINQGDETESFATNKLLMREIKRLRAELAELDKFKKALEEMGDSP